MKCFVCGQQHVVAPEECRFKTAVYSAAVSALGMPAALKVLHNTWFLNEAWERWKKLRYPMPDAAVSE